MKTYVVVDTDARNTVSIIEETDGSKVEITVCHFSHKEGRTIREIMVDRAYAYDRMDEISGEEY